MTIKDRCADIPAAIDTIQSRWCIPALRKAGHKLGVRVTVLADGRTQNRFPGSRLRISRRDIYVRTEPTEVYSNKYSETGMSRFWTQVRDLQSE